MRAAPVILVLLISVLAPLLASSNPDGLESTAEKLGASGMETVLHPAPLADYTFPGIQGDLSAVFAMLTGTGAVLILGFLAAEVLRSGRSGD